ncbi:phosphogluconate dehydratase [Pseudomonas sp. BAY1663]|nr:phosphogluconate dehydratase [Pseudomonas sp. BAY1663]
MHPRILEVTERLIERSRATRTGYLAMIDAAASDGPQRGKLQCANFAHGVASCGGSDKQRLRLMDSANVAIVTAYNDMLSAHQPTSITPSGSSACCTRSARSARWRAACPPCAMA